MNTLDGSIYAPTPAQPPARYADWPPPNHFPDRRHPPGECHRCGGPCEASARACADCFGGPPTLGLSPGGGP